METNKHITTFSYIFAKCMEEGEGRTYLIFKLNVNTQCASKYKDNSEKKIISCFISNNKSTASDGISSTLKIVSLVITVSDIDMGLPLV